ncbi:hypothetical protein A7E78_09390 [Syntrophotalea acetylenivorans]|uniref:Uncharacterized protein n=1 Tax=Syntrophotalea acetylenivorans TaxID=1842532 RepID=A0A1L3GQ88_9BACT|nr:hypothetical protein [Syntrophotalea acetylenivorans]APG28030.1 hypothetical protein A7E78_09390 [Syntrophotalea acetylenivorans]
MSIPEILRLESQLRDEPSQKGKSSSGRRRSPETDLSAATISTRKRIIASTMQKMEFINGTFTGKLIISFKEGGVSYIEKIEQFK